MTMKSKSNEHKHASVRTAHICVHMIVHNCCTQHGTQ